MGRMSRPVGVNLEEIVGLAIPLKIVGLPCCLNLDTQNGRSHNLALAHILPVFTAHAGPGRPAMAAAAGWPPGRGAGASKRAASGRETKRPAGRDRRSSPSQRETTNDRHLPGRSVYMRGNCREACVLWFTGVSRQGYTRAIAPLFYGRALVLSICGALAAARPGGQTQGGGWGESQDNVLPAALAAVRVGGWELAAPANQSAAANPARRRPPRTLQRRTGPGTGRDAPPRPGKRKRAAARRGDCYPKHRLKLYDCQKGISSALQRVVGGVSGASRRQGGWVGTRCAGQPIRRRQPRPPATAPASPSGAPDRGPAGMPPQPGKRKRAAARRGDCSPKHRLKLYDCQKGISSSL